MAGPLEQELERELEKLEKAFRKRIDRMIRDCEKRERDEKEDSFTRAVYDYAPRGTDGLMASLDSGVKLELERAKRELSGYRAELRTQIGRRMAREKDAAKARKVLQAAVARERKDFDRRLAELMG